MATQNNFATALRVLYTIPHSDGTAEVTNDCETWRRAFCARAAKAGTEVLLKQVLEEELAAQYAEMSDNGDQLRENGMRRSCVLSLTTRAVRYALKALNGENVEHYF